MVMNASAALLVQTLGLILCTPCPPGEYTIRECLPSNNISTVCWPCEAGFACANGSSRTQCRVGKEWAGVGATKCAECSGGCGSGRLLVKQCDDGESDRVCAGCPVGYGCKEDVMQMCRPGTYSHLGVCKPCGKNYTTRGTGAKSEAECVCLYSDEYGRCVEGCAYGQIVVGGECRTCPRGFGCDRDTGHLQQCKSDTYSSSMGTCVGCGSNSYSNAGAGSEDECVCDGGFTKSANSGKCMPCRPGTMYESGKCIPCPAGKYCLGRLHHEPCPEDMFSHVGWAVCAACRMNSGCNVRSGLCVDQANCTCDDGFVEHGGECRRCPAAMMKPVARHVEGDKNALVQPSAAEGCVPCPRGMECNGGAEVRSCGLATFSGGNRSRCIPCAMCKEITVARCNATHDSVCEDTPYALAVVTLTQYYKTRMDGETFAMFAMVLTSSLPKAQLVKVCGGGGDLECVHCFQGQCPVARMKRIITPSGENSYEIVVEIRSNTARLVSNVESLTQTAYLPELAKTTMSKLTTAPFTLRTRVEHAVVCPDEAEWNGSECVPPLTTNVARTWLGLAVSVVLLLVLGVYRTNRRTRLDCVERKANWARVDEVTESD